MSIISYSEFKNKYRFDCQLSQGSFGRVCRIQQNQSKKYFALKKVAVKRKQQLDDIENEIQLLHQFKHPFVVQIKESYKIQIKSGFAKPIWEVGVIMELAKCSLQQIIRNKKDVGSFKFIIEQTAGLIKVLFILQQQNIAHRDIKPANILIFINQEDAYHWKLADFGLALNLGKNREQDNFAGSYQYASPKLKRKFKYANLKIKTNPFKDDVYSLGVTLLETVTGLRAYNTTAYEKLRAVCDEKRLIDLIDMMLEQDQQKRPCFKQLMIIMEKDFKMEMENVAEENKFHSLLQQYPKAMQKKYSNASQSSSMQQFQPDKTIIKKQHHHSLSPYSHPYPKSNIQHRHNNKYKYNINNINNQHKNTVYNINIKKTLIQVGKPIQCVANLDGIIMCGCQTGQIMFVKNNQIISTGQPIHGKFVSCFYVDNKGNVWSSGADHIIRKWYKNSIIKSLISQSQLIKTTQTKLYKTHTQQHQLPLLVLKPSHYIQHPLPFTHKCGISTIYCIDQYNLAVGYYDGYVYIRWDGLQFHGKIFRKTVTAIKYIQKEQRIIICALDGLVKIINTRQCTLENRLYYRPDAQFNNILINDNTGQQQHTMNIITLDGRQYILKTNLQPIFQNIPASTTNSTIMASIQSNNNNSTTNTTNNNEGTDHSNYYLLTQNGILYDSNQDKIAELGGRGWNCMTFGDCREIVIGGYAGNIAVLQW